MNELDTRAERFLASIRAEGEAACAAIRAQTEQEIAQQLAETREAETQRAQRTLKFEVERARTRANRDLSAARMQARAQLAAQRARIADAVFSDAGKELAAFAAGTDYAAWLTRRAQALAEALGAGSVLKARPADLPLLQKAGLTGVTLAADDTITLGGLRGENTAGGVAADDTLEARLNSQREWFLQNAGLEITL